MLKLLKQPSLAEMAAAAVRRHKAEGGSGGGGGGGSGGGMPNGPVVSMPVTVIHRPDGSVDHEATRAAASAQQHRFWDTQPVPKLGEWRLQKEWPGVR